MCAAPAVAALSVGAVVIISRAHVAERGCLARCTNEGVPNQTTTKNTQVRAHPWFTARLPRYLAVMQADPSAARPREDNEVVEEVGFQAHASATRLGSCLQRSHRTKLVARTV